MQEKESHKETKSKLEIAEETIKQNKCKLEMLEKVLSSFDNKLKKKNLEYEKIIRQKEFLLEKMENELSHVVDEHEKRNLDYEEATVKFQTENKWLKERIEELEKTNVGKDENIQELKEEIRQKDSKLDDLGKELSDVKDKLEKRNLDYQEMKKKYEEKVVKLNVSAMKGLELKHSQQQQLDENASTDSDLPYSKELKECISLQKKYLDAWFNNDNIMYWKWYNEYHRCANGLSAEDKKKCIEVEQKYRYDLKKIRMTSQ